MRVSGGIEAVLLRLALYLDSSSLSLGVGEGCHECMWPCSPWDRRRSPKGQGSPHMAKLRLSNPREAGSLLLALVQPCLGCREHSLQSHCPSLLSSYSSHCSTLIPVVWKNPSVTLPSFRSRVGSGGLSKALATCRSLYCFPDEPHPQEQLPLRGGSFLSSSAAGAVNYLELLSSSSWAF